MSHGGKRSGAGRPKEKSWQQVAIDLSAPTDWPDYAPPVYRETGRSTSAEYRPSKASAIRSGIPAQAHRIQQLEVKSGRARRSLSEIENERVVKTHTHTVSKTTASVFRSKAIQSFLAAESDSMRSGAIDAFIHPSVSRVWVDGELREPGCSMSDFVYERFWDGTMQPVEIRGLTFSRGEDALPLERAKNRNEWSDGEKHARKSEYSQRRRFAIRNNPGYRPVTQADRVRMFEAQSGECHYCENTLDISVRPSASSYLKHLDHRVPVAKGGPHNPSNLCWACRSCNLIKGDRLTEDELLYELRRREQRPRGER